MAPHGDGHVLRSEPGVPAPGILDLEREAVGNLIEILPSTLRIEAATSPRLEWMQSVLRLMASEAAELRPGGEAVTRASETSS